MNETTTSTIDSDPQLSWQNGQTNDGTYSSYYYTFTSWKLLLLLWDLSGVVVQGLGTDMLWHGVEINHAVYSLLLQDVVLGWASSLLWWIFNWWWWKEHYLVWAQAYMLFCSVPIAFHNMAWAVVAFLRWFNITDNEGWLQQDQGTLRLKWTSMTWLGTGVHLSILIPVCHWIYTPWSPRMTLYAVVMMTTLVPTLIAILFYLKILKYARALSDKDSGKHVSGAARENNGDNNHSGGGRVMGAGDVVVPLERIDPEIVHNVNAVFDDSDDEDLLNPIDSPSIKQASASYLALKTMLALNSLQHCLLAVYSLMGPDSNLSLVAVTTFVSFLRHPAILFITVINFGPIRSTFTVYVENLPGHLMGMLDPFIDWLCHWKIGSQDDQRSIVQGAATSEGPSFHGQISGVVTSGGIVSANMGSAVVMPGSGGDGGGGGGMHTSHRVVPIQMQSPSKPALNCRDCAIPSRNSSSNGSLQGEKVLPNVQC